MMSAIIARNSFLLARQGATKLYVPKMVMVPSQRAFTMPASLKRFWARLEKVESEIDEELRPGSNLPFNIKNPRALAIKFIIYMAIGFNLPILITYFQMKNARTG